MQAGVGGWEADEKIGDAEMTGGGAGLPKLKGERLGVEVGQEACGGGCGDVVKAHERVL